MKTTMNKAYSYRADYRQAHYDDQGLILAYTFKNEHYIDEFILLD